MDGQESGGRPLTREDWIEAAVEVLVNSSIEQVKVERLALALKVSKGSFYWHFQNREQLLDALLNRWVQLSTIEPRTRLVDPEPSAIQRLLLILRLPLRSLRALKAADVELAMLGWARRSQAAAAAVAEVDRFRVSDITEQFREMGADPQAAETLAHTAYAFTRYVSQRRDLAADEKLELTAKVHRFLADLAIGPNHGG